MSLCIPGMQTADPLDKKKTIDPLDQWDCVLEWNCRASTKCNTPYLVIFALLILQYSLIAQQQQNCPPPPGIFIPVLLYSSSTGTLLALSLLSFSFVLPQDYTCSFLYFASFLFIFLPMAKSLFPQIVLFATVPDSWDSWFFFNLRKNKHLLLHK